VLRAGDGLFRIGGDEFAALLPSATTDDTDVIAGRLVQAARRARTTVSIGTPMIHPGMAPEHVRLTADQALYAAKATGRDRRHMIDRCPTSLEVGHPRRGAGEPAAPRVAGVPQVGPTTPCPEKPYEQNLRYGRRVDLGYARVSSAKQDLDRQVDALHQAGIAPERIYLDKKSGATTDRPGLRAALEYARGGDVIVVHTLDRLGRTVRDTLNLIHELAERGVGVRNLADPIRVNSSNPADPMAQLAVVLSPGPSILEGPQRRGLPGRSA
jgi:hypothetical protein